MAPRKHENAAAREASCRQRERDERDAERAAMKARIARTAIAVSEAQAAATAKAIQVYREAKAERAEKGVTFDGSSGRHPIKHKHEMRSFRIAQ